MYKDNKISFTLANIEITDDISADKIVINNKIKMKKEDLINLKNSLKKNPNTTTKLMNRDNKENIKPPQRKTLNVASKGII